MKRLHCEPKSPLRENQNKENETCFEMKCVSVAFKICSEKFEWLSLILIYLILIKNKLFHKYQIYVIYW